MDDFFSAALYLKNIGKKRLQIQLRGKIGDLPLHKFVSGCDDRRMNTLPVVAGEENLVVTVYQRVRDDIFYAENMPERIGGSFCYDSRLR